MSPRTNRGRGRPPARPERSERIEESAGGDWVVRAVTGAASTKSFRCPGCDHEIKPGLPHVVAWPAYDADAADRRHWHSACWEARDRRGIKVHRSKNGPRHG